MKYTAEWTDWPAALAAHNGDKEAATDHCHDNNFDCVVEFKKFSEAVQFAKSKASDDYFGLPRVYRWVEYDKDDFGQPLFEREAFWDCDNPEAPIFEAYPTGENVNGKG